MSCRCGRHNNDKENAPLAQLVEHLPCSPISPACGQWVCRVRAPGGALERTVFGDLGAPGTVLFLSPETH